MSPRERICNTLLGHIHLNFRSLWLVGWLVDWFALGKVKGNKAHSLLYGKGTWIRESPDNWRDKN